MNQRQSDGETASEFVDQVYVGLWEGRSRTPDPTKTEVVCGDLIAVQCGKSQSEKFSKSM